MSKAKVSLDHVYNILLVILAVSLPLPDRVAPIIIILLVITSVLLRLKYKIYEKPQIISYLFFLIFFYYIIRLYGSQDLDEGLKFVEKNLIYFVIPAVIIPKLIKNANFIYKGLIISFSAISLYSILLSFLDFFFFNQKDNRWYFQNIEDYGFHPTYMGLYAIVCIIIIDRKKLFSHRINLLLIGVNILFIIFTASRIAILALMILFIFRAIFFKKKEYVVVLIVSSLASVSFYFISDDFQYKINQLSTFKGLDHYDNNDYGSVSVRVAKITAANNVWQEHLWFGYGTGGLNEALNKQYRSKAIECWPCSRQKYNPHNQYLSILAGHGIIGFVLFALLIIFLVYKAIKSKNYILIELILVFLIFGLTESILERQKGILIFVILPYLIFTVNENITNNKSLKNQ